MRISITRAAAVFAAALAARGQAAAQHHGSATSAACPLRRPASASSATGVTPGPGTLWAHNGLLRVQLTILPGSVRFGGTTYTRNLYSANGGPAAYLPPTLRLNPGDSLDLTVTNCMSQGADTLYIGNTATNFHFHGFNVTPRPPAGDQVVTVLYDTLQAHHYAFRLPRSHPQGMHWYHPHPHGNSDAQVGGGMSGAIVIGDVRGRIPGGAAIPERTILIKDFQPFGPNHSGGSFFTLNGDSSARFVIPSGGRQIWHLGNVGSDTPLGIKLLGDRGRMLPMTVLARDGNPVHQPEAVDSLRLWPAERYDLLVETDAAPGTRFAIVNTDSSNAVNARGDTLGWLTVGAGHPVQHPRPAADPAVRARIASLLAARVDTSRTFVFSEDFVKHPDDGFLINDEPYVHERIDVRIPLGRVEEWTLVNRPSGNLDPHVFHIHQGDFIVTSINGRRVTPNSFQDRLDLAPGDSITVRIPFVDPWQVGLYVFHCHILFHEDHGMMKNICVYDPRRPGSTCTVQGR